MSADVASTVPDKTPGGHEFSGHLQAILDGIAERLQVHDLITQKGIRVLPEYAGDFYNQLAALLNKRLSVLCVVALDGVDSKATGMTASFGDIGISITCMENVLLNQSSAGVKVGALTLAELACGWLHCHQLANGQQLWMRESETLQRVTDGQFFKPDAGVICYSARFFTRGCPKTDFS